MNLGFSYENKEEADDASKWLKRYMVRCNMTGSVFMCSRLCNCSRCAVSWKRNNYRKLEYYVFALTRATVDRAEYTAANWFDENEEQNEAGFTGSYRRLGDNYDMPPRYMRTRRVSVDDEELACEALTERELQEVGRKHAQHNIDHRLQ